MAVNDRREARKFGTDTPHEPTDEFVVNAFTEGARSLWPDSRDPGWQVTFRRWLERRDKALTAQMVAEARTEGTRSGIRLAIYETGWWCGECEPGIDEGCCTFPQRVKDALWASPDA